MKIAVYTNILRVRVLARRCAADMEEPEVRVCAVDGMDRWEEKRAAADLHLFLWMGTGLDNDFLKQASRDLQKRRMLHLIVVDNAEHDKVTYGFSEEQIQRTWAYFRYDGEENMRNLFRWLGIVFGGLSCTAEPPTPLAWNGVYHPAWAGDPEDIAGYLGVHYVEGRPTVGVIFYRSEWITGDFTYHTALIRAIEAEEMNAVAVFSNAYRDERVESPTLMEAIEKYFCRDGTPYVDVIISTMKFSLKAGGTRPEDLYALGVPVLEAYTVLAPKEEWERSPAGLDPMEVSMSVAMPEFDGVIHAVPIAAKVRDEAGEVSYAPLDERMERMARKARKWAALRHKPNAEKKVAIVFHNYPATNANIGSAAGLDSPESVLSLLRAMRTAGYVMEEIPESSKAFMKLLTDHATNDRRFMTMEQAKSADGQLTAAQYGAFFTELPEQVRTQLERDWGDAPGDVFN